MYTELWYMPSTPRLLYRFKKQKKPPQHLAVPHLPGRGKKLRTEALYFSSSYQFKATKARINLDNENSEPVGSR